MLIVKETDKSMEEVDRAIHEAAASRSFGVLTVHDLAETMKKKGVDYSGECRIFEVCNAHQAKKVLEAEPLVSTALPCRISVFRKKGKLVVATMRPTWMIGAFDSADLKQVALEVEKMMEEIMEQACT